MPSQRSISTSHGEAAVLVHQARAPSATLVLGHGAGGGSGAPDLTALAQLLPRHGITVVRVEQPWRVARRRVAPAPRVLDEVFVTVVTALRARGPLVVGGRSAGARVACRTARQLSAAGCLALAFPLHPPGQPEKSRLAELEAAAVPTLVVQGERDAFGRPEEFPEGIELAIVPGADHSFSVLRSGPLAQPDAIGVLVEAVLEWVTREVA
ncbi:MAG TPA: alpha/beta family hydrolase [Nocardioidaceae bacterium]|nr:alpha/beta family hydrolase [Nocardioidaceae bacterium]